MEDLHAEIKKQLLHQLMQHMDKDNGSRLAKIMKSPGKDFDALTKRPSEDLAVHNDNKDIQDMKAPIVESSMHEPKKEVPDPRLSIFKSNDSKKKKMFGK